VRAANIQAIRDIGHTGRHESFLISLSCFRHPLSLVLRNCIKTPVSPSTQVSGEIVTVCDRSGTQAGEGTMGLK